MDSGYHRESYYPGYGDSGFSGYNPNHRPLDQYPTELMHQAAHLCSVTMQPTQRVWDVRGRLPQIPPVTSTNPTLLHVSGGGYSSISAQPVGSYAVQPLVSPAAISSVVIS